MIVEKENYKLYNGDCLEVMDLLIEQGIIEIGKASCRERV